MRLLRYSSTLPRQGYGGQRLWEVIVKGELARVPYAAAVVVDVENFKQACPCMHARLSISRAPGDNNLRARRLGIFDSFRYYTTT